MGNGSEKKVHGREQRREQNAEKTLRRTASRRAGQALDDWTL